MKKRFVKTTHYTRFLEAVRAVEGRGAAEAGMILVHGQPGYGKSCTVERWAVDTGAVFLRAKVDWTPRAMLRELAAALHSVDVSGSSHEIYGRVVAHISRTGQAIVIDEAEHCLAAQALVLEKLRDISDYTETLVVLIGMERIQRAIARYGQISSRISQAVEFGPATPEDVAYACAQLAEVEIVPDLAQEIHRLSGGRMREVMHLIAEVERICRANGLARADMDTFRGVPLGWDWARRAPKTCGGASCA